MASRLLRYVRVKRFEELTGYSEKAVYEKIRAGVWIEGRQYRKAPDGHVLVDLEGFERWVESQQTAA